MKKLKISLFILFLLIATISTKDVYALSSNTLMSLGSGKYYINLTQNTTIDDIIKVLGEPKLETDSAFGGHAYTFYTDNNYSNYLYIETTSNDKIISYGSLDETFETNTYSYGDNYPYDERSPLYGCLYSNNGIVGAGIFYNVAALGGGNYTDVISLYETNYESNPIKYLKGLSQQAILMYNALSFKLGNKDTTPLVYDEEYFYINEQFKEFGTTIREYMLDMDLNISYMKGIGVKSDVEVATRVYYLLNPLLFADLAGNNKYTVFDEKNIAIFDYDYDRKILSAISISDDAFERTEDIDLTDEETTKLAMGRAEYELAIKKFNESSSVYDVNPQVNNASSLVAGKLNKSISEAITAYVNAIRVAAGAPKVQLDSESFEVAQYKATLLSYRYLVLGLDIAHSPEQPSGVSDSFYNTAMGNGKGYLENIGTATSNPNMTSIMNSIDTFLDDSSEIPQLFSHRQKILSNLNKYFGFGYSTNVFTNEFSGINEYTNYLEAWPSEGITFMETLLSPRFKWTAQFTDKYTILDTTTATIKCLNTGDTWEFTEQENTTNRWFACHTNSVSYLNNKVVMYDSSIVVQPGYVYEITLHGIKEDSTSKVVDYTYRAAFEYADISNYPTTLTELEIVVPEGTNFIEDEDYDIYMLPVGEEINLGLKIDENIVDKKVTWTSSNNKVKITQNGIIYADGLLDDDEGDVTITVSYDGSNVTDQIIVRPYIKLNQVRLDKTEMECEALGEGYTSSQPSFSLYIEYIPSDANEVKSVNWKIVSLTNENIKYDIDDEYIQDYVKIVQDPSDPKRVDVYAITAELNNNKYKIITEVDAISGTYTGECALTIDVPIDDVRIVPSSLGLSISSSVLNINYNSYNKNTFDLSTDIYPKNATYDKTIQWIIGDSNIISKNNSNINSATFNILKEGETKLTAKSINGITNTITVRISAEITKLVLNCNTQNIYINSTTSPNTAQLSVTREPSIDTDNIIYVSENTDIAQVSNSGLVTFNNPGTVSITAYSENNTSVKDKYTFHVYSLISSIAINNNSVETLYKGKSIQTNITCLPSNNSFSNKITYKSSDSSVATVDESGKVTGVGPGIAKISATVPGTYTTNGVSREVYYMVNVKAPIEKINTDTTKTMIINQQSTFNVSVVPSNTTSKYTIKWESLNPDILQINASTGIATANKIGTATVRVTVSDRDTGNSFKEDITVSVVNYLKGDMNKDGYINSVDAALIMNRFQNNNATDEEIAIGDIDNNGILNVVDAALVMNMYKNNTTFN